MKSSYFDRRTDFRRYRKIIYWGRYWEIDNFSETMSNNIQSNRRYAIYISFTSGHTSKRTRNSPTWTHIWTKQCWRFVSMLSLPWDKLEPLFWKQKEWFKLKEESKRQPASSVQPGNKDWPMVSDNFLQSEIFEFRVRSLIYKLGHREG